MKTKDNIVGIRLDEQSLERLDALCVKLGNRTRSATLRRLLMFVDRDCGAAGACASLVKWSKRIDARPLF